MGNNSGSPFGSFFSFFGGGNNSTANNNSSCPVTNFFTGRNTVFGGNNCTPSDADCQLTNNNCPPTSNNCPPVSNNCPPVSNNCLPENNNCNTNIACTANNCEPVKTPEIEPPEITEPNRVCSTYAEEVLKLVNEERTSRGLSALELDENLCAAAEVRAGEVLRRFSHTRPNRTSWMTVFNEFGISYNICGENIARGFNSSKSVVDAWMNSSGHRANILNPNYTHMGVGKNGTGWGQLFTG
jgi:uncharacterized protein YkwD